nr:PREDICTED: protein disulfide-isomerase-like isoform X2 [Lepisosteus oculatus]
MKTPSLFLLSAACLCAAVAGNSTLESSGDSVPPAKKEKPAKINEENGVLVLKKSNFDQALRQHKYLLVDFHAPLSGDSQSLSREFTAAAARLKSQGSRIRLGLIDVSKEKDLANELNVTAYPALWFYISGDKENPVICPVLRTATSIVTWLERRTGRSAELIKDRSQAEEFFKLGDVVVLGFFQDLEEGAVKTFYEAAVDIPDLPFGVTKNKSLFSKYKVRKDRDTVVLFKQSEVLKEYEVSSETLKESLIKFLRVHEMDLVTEYNGEVLFIFVDTDESRNGRIFEYFRVRDVDAPAVRIVNLTDNVQYQMQAEEVTVDNVRKFCGDFIDGKAKPKLESEPIPENWDKHPVKELVAVNFDRVVFNDERNVFVMFYAPWSKECQELFPVWEKLGKVYGHHETVVIARIDSAANDVHSVLQERHPAFKFFPAVLAEKVVPYAGKRTLEDFVQFVEDQIELAKEQRAKEEEDTRKMAEPENSEGNQREEL